MKKTELKTKAQAVIFWFHVFLIMGFISLGLFFSPLIIVLVAIAHRLHVLVFKECLLSKLQRRLGGLAESESFLQAAGKKLFGLELTLSQCKQLDAALVGLPMIIALIKLS